MSTWRESKVPSATLAVFCSGLLVIGCVGKRPKPASIPRPGAAYIAMGSSFAAGAGIGPRQANSPERCDRTTNNYPSLLAQELSLELIDVTCGGATTADVLTKASELPAQVDQVSPATELVTITIGGNDLRYMAALFYGSCRSGLSSIMGQCRPVVEPAPAEYDQLRRNLVQIVTKVRERAPRARVIFVQYVTVLSATPCPTEAITTEAAEQGRRVALTLSELTRKAADESAAEVLEADLTSREHTSCSKEPWSNGFHLNFPRTVGAPWHPNAAGHAAVARLLTAHLRSGAR